LYSVSKRVGLTAVAGSAALILAACGSSGGGSAAPASSSPASSAPASVPTVSATDFTNDFSVMAKLKPLAAEGKGGVGVILPDTTTSARYTEFDAPYLTKALTAAGLTSSQFSVQNAQGSDATQLSLAQADITKGDSVLIMDPLDSGVGKSIEKYAAAHGAVVIDYDRLTLGGSRKYYVSFDNVKVGKLIGNGLVSCIADWKVKNPNVLVMRIQPDEGVSLTFEVKPPGHDMEIRPLSLDFNYGEAFGNSPPEAYETLLEDCIEGDSTLFTRHDWVELAWSLVDPIIQVWDLSRPRNFPNYEAGSWGPKEADDFMAREGRRWRKP